MLAYNHIKQKSTKILNIIKAIRHYIDYIIHKIVTSVKTTLTVGKIK